MTYFKQERKCLTFLGINEAMNLQNVLLKNFFLKYVNTKS